MRTVIPIAILVLISALAGCGNVYLQGEALTAAETSALDARQAAMRANADPAAPEWIRYYLEENYHQWRFFVRAAKKNDQWGPEIMIPKEGEQ